MAMKRRTFLAAVGAFLAAPLAARKASPVEPTVEIACLSGIFVSMKAHKDIPFGTLVYWDHANQVAIRGDGIPLGRCVPASNGLVQVSL